MIPQALLTWWDPHRLPAPPRIAEIERRAAHPRRKSGGSAPRFRGDEPIVSMVLPIYNGAAFLERALESIFGQRYPGLEIIAVDGGSTDGTVAILERHDARLHAWISEPDESMYDAINKGIAASTGSIVKILNADDELTDDSVACAVAALKDDDRAFVRGNIDVIDAQGRVVNSWTAANHASFLPDAFPLLHPSWYVPRRVYAELGLYQPRYRIAADTGLLLPPARLGRAAASPRSAPGALSRRGHVRELWGRHREPVDPRPLPRTPARRLRDRATRPPEGALQRPSCGPGRPRLCVPEGRPAPGTAMKAGEGPTDGLFSTSARGLRVRFRRYGVTVVAAGLSVAGCGGAEPPECGAAQLCHAGMPPPIEPPPPSSTPVSPWIPTSEEATWSPLWPSFGGCGECGVGAMVGAECVYPSQAVDPALGLPPADTSDRMVFDPDDYEGTDSQRLQQAINDAEPVAGAVVLGRVFEVVSTPYIGAPMLFTGGGLRRACTPVAIVTSTSDPTDHCVQVDSSAGFVPTEAVIAFTSPATVDHVTKFWVNQTTATTLCQSSPIGVAIPQGAQIVRRSNLLSVDNPTDGVIVDSVFFDGANRCNGHTHDWRFNNAVTFRGDNVLQNSVFYDSPGEGITVCGATIRGNMAFSLQGSFIHKSCGSDPEPLDIVENNYIDGVNLATDEVMKHSEGAITHSANAGTIQASGNVFRNGSEGVFGVAGPDDEGVAASADCYAHFPHVIQLYNGASQSGFVFDVELIDVPVIFKE